VAVLEAMKWEMPIFAEEEGIGKEINVEPEETVKSNEVLLKIE
jgi:biotin carboxyl carrier protein